MSLSNLPLATLQISGDDATNFLQNLLTNDVNDLKINQAQLTGLCNPKGRLFATFYLVRRENHYQIILPKSMLSLLQQRLSMYILRSKVTISDQSDAITLFGLMSNNDIALSAITYQGIGVEQGLIIKLSGNPAHFLYIVSTEYTDNSIDKLTAENWQVITYSHWQQAEIEAGIPTVITETKESFTPQQINFDLINGVSFSKGCYPGQEIVARLHYLGSPSRRLFSANCATNTNIEIGSTIVDANNTTVGHCVNANTIEHHSALLLSLKLADSEQDLFLITGEIISGVQALNTEV